jgi:cell division protein FtsW
MVGLIAAWIPSLADVHRGSHRWLKVGVGAWSFSVQPSEFAKVAMVLFVAVLLTRPGVELRDFRRGFVPPMIAGAACAGLVGLADFGTAVLLASVVGIMLLVGGCRMLHLAILTLGGCIGLGVLLLAEPYRLERVDSFLRMWQDPQGVGYQPVQSLVTIASGGWMGAGLGAGVQKYGYLPESHTDFIFAILCEETGVLGGAFVMALFGALVLLGWRTVRSAATPFERLVALGLTSVIGLQAVMNIAVVTVVVPTKGMSLPLISAGGSGLLACCLAITILVAIAARAGAVAHTQAFHAVHPKNQNEERAHGRDPAVGYAAGQPSW